jgi:hypothetical protein
MKDIQEMRIEGVIYYIILLILEERHYWSEKG